MSDTYRPIVRDEAPAKRSAAKKTTRKRAAKKVAPPPVEQPTEPAAPAENEESA